MKKLSVRNLSVTVGGKPVLERLNLEVPDGELHALMGKNGAGKSSLAKVLVGHPDYVVTSGKIEFCGEAITTLAPHERARRGLFLAFQNPLEIPGVTVANFMRAAMNACGKGLPTVEFYKELYRVMDIVGLDHSFSSRAVNVGFSGGEKKRCELLQLLLLRPKFVILDEIDSGLDQGALKVVLETVKTLRSGDFSGIIITHYREFLQQLAPDRIHVMKKGSIVHSGDCHLLDQLDTVGDELFTPSKPDVSSTASESKK